MVAVLDATNSEPYVAVPTVACLLENESMGVWVTMCGQPVSHLPEARQGFRFASIVVVVVTVFPRDLGMSSGIISFTSL